MEYVYLEAFLDDLENLPKQIRKKAKKALRLFQDNQRHPSLRTKKIKGTKSVFESRVDKSYRFTFEYGEDSVIFRRIGKHDIVDKEASQD